MPLWLLRLYCHHVLISLELVILMTILYSLWLFRLAKCLTIYLLRIASAFHFILLSSTCCSLKYTSFSSSLGRLYKQ